MSNDDADKKKRRLVMLPEVLPTPQRTQPRDAGPRERTRAHLQRIMGAAALVGTAGWTDCRKPPAAANVPDAPNPPPTPPGGGPGYWVVDMMPAPPPDVLVRVLPELDASTPPARPDAGPGATPDAARHVVHPPVPHPHPPSGYRVVDPMPNPAWRQRTTPQKDDPEDPDDGER